MKSRKKGEGDWNFCDTRYKDVGKKAVAAVSIFSGMGFMYWSDCFQDQSNGFYRIGGLGGVLWCLVTAVVYKAHTGKE